MGVPKGYRIQLNGIMKQLYPEDWLMVPMMSWSLYQVAVTRYVPWVVRVQLISLLVFELSLFTCFVFQIQRQREAKFLSVQPERAD